MFKFDRTTCAKLKRMKALSPLMARSNRYGGPFKPHSEENELISWHYSHTDGTTVKDNNIVTFTYSTTYQQQKVVVKSGASFVEAKHGRFGL